MKPECTDQSTPLIAIVTPVYNRKVMTDAFLTRVAQQYYESIMVVIVDCDSTDGTGEMLAAHEANPLVITVSEQHYWAGATNAGIKAAIDAGARYIVTLNDDGDFSEDLIEQLYDAHVTCGERSIIGVRQMFDDDRERVFSLGSSLCGFRLFKLNACHTSWTQVQKYVDDYEPVQCFPGNGVFLPVEVFSEVGFYDEKNLPHYHADSDMIMRAREHGFEAYISMDTVVYDHPHRSLKSRYLFQAMFQKRSDRYLPAIWALCQRYVPLYLWPVTLLYMYLPYMIIQPLRTKLYALRIRRMSDQPVSSKAELLPPLES